MDTNDLSLLHGQQTSELMAQDNVLIGLDKPSDRSGIATTSLH